MASTLQLVDRDGKFDKRGLDDFVGRVELDKCGLSYAVVAIMGPQSSGKSTLLNHLFGTTFVEMNAETGRKQTTQGVWMAEADRELIKPCTLVVDLEGTDGAERGEDDTLFERQSALFALAVADILLINIWKNDIGRNAAANRPLLKTIFEVLMRLNMPRKMTLMYVIRDMTSSTPIEVLESDLQKDVEKVWDIVKKPANHEHTPLSEFFNVHVTSLANFEEKRQEFEKDVAKLRELFQDSIAPGRLAGDCNRTAPGSGFSLSTEGLWQKIKENKDLDLPTHKVMLATVRCGEIATETLESLKSADKWLSVQRQAEEDVVSEFGKTVDALVKEYLDKYRAESDWYDEGIRILKQNDLTSGVFKVIRRSYWKQIKHHQDKALSDFKRSLDSNIESNPVHGFWTDVRREALDMFDRGCDDAKVADSKWDPSESREKLSQDMTTYWQEKRKAKFAELRSSLESGLKDALEERTVAILAVAGESTSSTGIWSNIHSLLKKEVANAQSNFVASIRGFDPTREETKRMQESLAEYGRSVVKKKAKDQAPRALDLMMNRFKEKLTYDGTETRQWAKKNYDIPAIARDAKSSSLKLLATLVAVRLDDTSNHAEHSDGIDIESGCLIPLVLLPDSMLDKFKRTFWDDTKSPTEKRDEALLELTTKTAWRNVSDGDTLIKPSKFKSIWISFETEARSLVDRVALEKKTAKSNRDKNIATGAALGVGAVVTGAAATVVAAI